MAVLNTAPAGRRDSPDSPLLFQIYCSQINLSSPRAVIFGLIFSLPTFSDSLLLLE